MTCNMRTITFLAALAAGVGGCGTTSQNPRTNTVKVSSGVDDSVPAESGQGRTGAGLQIVSVPDEGTELNEARAEKARTLAEYVLARGDCTSLHHFDGGEADDLVRVYCQSAGDVIETEDYRYFVSVNTAYISQDYPSSISISQSMLLDDGPHSAVTRVSDHGLDGRVNFGLIKFGGVVKDVEYDDFNEADPCSAPNFARTNEEAENEDQCEALRQDFQNEYRDFLTELIGFYESK